MAKRFLILWVVFFWARIDAAPSVSPEQFTEWYRTHLSAVPGGLRIPDAVATKARHYHYVFIAGFLNEAVPGYFTNNISELWALGVPAGNIHTIYPASGKSVEDNSELIREQVKDCLGEGAEKIVIIGHSRGRSMRSPLRSETRKPSRTRSKRSFWFRARSEAVRSRSFCAGKATHRR